MQEIGRYLLPSVLFVSVLVLLIVIVRRIYGSFAMKRHENNYKTGMITIINEKTEENEAFFESVNNQYTEYSSSARKKEWTLDVFTLNTKLIHELRNHKYKRYYKGGLPDHGKIANEVEEINKHLHERLRNDDEVLIEILGKIDELPVDDQVRNSLETYKGEILSYISAIIAASEGRIVEKEIALSQKETQLKKAKRLRIVTILVGVIGVFSGLITIANNLFLK